MINRLQSVGNSGMGYFSREVTDYAARMKPENEQGGGEPKTIGEFSKKERDKKFEEHVLLDNGCFCAMRFMKIENKEIETAKLPKQPDIKDTMDDMVAEEAIQRLLGKGKRAPYSVMADENGMIEYKGVVFLCDYEHNRLCLGDVSDPRNCITVGLEKGGALVFNRANIDDLVKAIGMFSPEDINRIMRAIAEDAKIRQTQMQIEDETSGVEVLDKPKDEKKAVMNQTEEKKDDESKRKNEQPDF